MSQQSIADERNYNNSLIQQMSQQSIADEKNYNNSLIQQPNWLELVLHGEQNQGHSTGEVCWKYLVF